MIPSADTPLAEQRLALRQRLQAQREQIARLLDPTPGSDNAYPRSITMRFLIRRPQLAATLLAGLATSLIGARIFRS